MAETCAAHALLVEMVQHQRGAISDLYDLNRDMKDEIAENNVRTATLEIELSMLSKNFGEFREENERHQASINKQLNTITQMFEREKKSRKWKPGHLVAVVASISAPIGAVIIALLNKGPGK